MSDASSRILDEFAKLMTDAAGVAQGVKREAETAIRAQAERFLADMDIVNREEFAATMELAANARSENEALRERVETLEKRMDALETVKKPVRRKASENK